MDYDFYLERAISIFNQRMGTGFSKDKLVLTCFITEDQEEIFEQFCSKYFPYRLNDRYHEDGYFDFRASSFVGMDNGGIDGILLRTDISYQPDELLHIFLHELAHLFCVHNELDGRSFFEEYCVGYATTKEEDGIINAGYAVWRECIAEIIAIELDDCCDIVPLKDKKDALSQFRNEIEPVDGKLLVSEILAAVMTSTEVETAGSWEDAEKEIGKLGLFTDPPEMDLFRLVYAQLRTTFVEIDVDFIHELGYLYLNILSLAAIRNLCGNRLGQNRE